MSLTFLILELLTRYGPDVAATAQRLTKPGGEPTQADWDDLFLKASKTYDTYIAEAEKRADG